MRDDVPARQREVATLIAQGLTAREIAERLGIAKVTVDVHRRDLMKRLGVKSIAGVVHHAIGEGWVRLRDVK